MIGSTVCARQEPLSAIVARQTGFGSRTIRKWLKCDAPPERRATAPKPCSPNYFIDYLRAVGPKGCVRGRELFHEIKLRGYTGSFSHLERLLAKWRGAADAKASPAVVGSQRWSRSRRSMAASLRRRSRDGVDDLADRCGFAMHQAAWFAYAKSGGEGRRSEKRLARIHSYAPAGHAVPRDSSRPGHSRNRRLARRRAAIGNLRNAALCSNGAQRSRRHNNAVTEGWSNGQTEGQINRLKTLKRAMYGRAGAELLRARMLPLHSPISTKSEAAKIRWRGGRREKMLLAIKSMGGESRGGLAPRCSDDVVRWARMARRRAGGGGRRTGPGKGAGGAVARHGCPALHRAQASQSPRPCP